MPLQAVIAFYVMYRSVGISALAGMIAMGLEAIPLQGETSMHFTKNIFLRKKVLLHAFGDHTD